MRKFMVSAVVAALMSFGLVGLSTTSASAIDCPYSGCIGTTTRMVAPDRIEGGTTPWIRVKVTPNSGNARVDGHIAIRCLARNGRAKFEFYPYKGNEFKRFQGPRLGKGRWVCRTRFSSDFKFKASSDSESIRAV